MIVATKRDNLFAKYFSGQDKNVALKIKNRLKQSTAQRGMHFQRLSAKLSAIE